jgi:hypothetical protein
MADSRRELLLEAGKAAIDKVGKPTGLTVHRHRTRPIARDQLPAVVLFNGVETILRQTTQPPILDRELVFRAECRAEGEPSDEVLDPILNWVETQLTTDPGFLALVRHIEVRRVIWDQEPAKKPLAAAAIEFAAQYRTKFGDPTSLP